MYIQTRAMCLYVNVSVRGNFIWYLIYLHTSYIELRKVFWIILWWVIFSIHLSATFIPDPKKHQTFVCIKFSFSRVTERHIKYMEHSMLPFTLKNWTLITNVSTSVLFSPLCNESISVVSIFVSATTTERFSVVVVFYLLFLASSRLCCYCIFNLCTNAGS